MRQTLDSALGDGYRVVREIGGGGMSRVFEAEELALGRRVVVKVLPPELTAEIEATRFRQEVQLVAGFQHPHIVPVYGAGAGTGLLWYTMPLVEGESLRQRLTREGPFPIGEAVRLWREILEALEYAHSRQVVHRDIKPENVLLSARHAMVTDFGIARAMTEGTGQHGLTASGVAIGTPAYMAPEQAMGDARVDARADLYASAVVAFEMLTGRAVFLGSSPQRLFAAHAAEVPPTVRELRPTVPEELAALVNECLAKDPADRPQTARALRERLELVPLPSGETRRTPAAASAGARRRRPMVFVLAFVVVAVLGGGVWWKLTRQATVAAAPPTGPREIIEVAELETTGVPRAVMLAVVQTLRSDLSEGSVIAVPAEAERADIMSWAAPYVPGLADGQYGRAQVRTLARRIALKAYVAGTISNLGGRTLLELQIYDAQVDTVLASARGEAADSSQLREAVATVAGSLRARAEAAIPFLTTPLYEGFATTTSREAFLLWAAANRTHSTGDWLSPVRAYRRALELDSTFALAATRMASALHNMSVGAGTAARAIDLAERERPRLPPSEQQAIDRTSARVRRDGAANAALVRLELEKSPSSYVLWNSLGLALDTQGDDDGSLSAFERAVRLNPRSELARANHRARLSGFSRRRQLDSVLRADSVLIEQGSWVYKAEAAEQRGRLRGIVDATMPLREAALVRDSTRGTRDALQSAAYIASRKAVRGELAASRRASAVQDSVLVRMELPGDRLVATIVDADLEARIPDRDIGVANLKAALSHAERNELLPLDRNHPFAAFVLARLGLAADAERELRAYANAVPPRWRMRDSTWVVSAHAEIAFIGGDYQRALQLAGLRERMRACTGCTLELVGRVHLARADTAAAIAASESFFDLLSSWTGTGYHADYPIVLRRLAELHEATGNRSKAIERYQQFVDLWERADPELQPAVQRARTRLAALQAAGR